MQCVVVHFLYHDLHVKFLDSQNRASASDYTEIISTSLGTSTDVEIATLSNQIARYKVCGSSCNDMVNSNISISLDDDISYEKM